MLNKLSMRNARRQAKDYLVYLLTMTLFVGLMFAFNTMLCSKEVGAMVENISLMAVMLWISTFFIILIIAWLIRYMVRFMMEKRSREFGTYLLLGMKKKTVSKLFMRENLILGTLSFLMGLVLGLFLQQVVMTIYYSLVDGSYLIRLELNPYSFLLTFVFYYSCYLIALRKIRKRFRKMNINSLMTMEKENQQIKERGESLKQWLFFGAVCYILLFYILIFRGKLSFLPVFFLGLGLILAIYMLYIGISAFIVRYIRRKGKGIYEGSNLFLLRQFSGKIKTMQFTLGTLTVLFAVALMGCSVAMMFSDYQGKQLDMDFPFDISLHSDAAEWEFAEELSIINEKTEIQKQYGYKLYHNGTNAFNTHLCTHLDIFGDTYLLPDKSENKELIPTEMAYYEYDTFMKLSDYNALREMLGRAPIHLEPKEYAVQINNRVYKEVKDTLSKVPVVIGEETYAFAGYYTDGFCQTGHNGADYCIIVTDEAAEGMEVLYSQMVLQVKEEAETGLQFELEEYMRDNIPEWILDASRGYGTEQIVVYGSDWLVRADIIPFMKKALTSITFPLVYVGLVYLCVALTILSVQQLSDSAKYRFRYMVLGKLGMKEKEIDKVILKQLFWYYLCPIAVAMVISLVVILFASERFIHYTGVDTPIFSYFGISVLVLLSIYVLYFAATYVIFRRNVAR